MAETSLPNVFRSRNYRLVFFGALVSDLGALMYSFAVSFYILEITDNNAFLQGLYLAVTGLVSLLIMPLGGVLGDRYNKAKIMFLCDYLKGGLILLTTALMALLPTAKAHLVLLFGLGVLGSAVSGVFSPAAGALFPSIVDEGQLQQANAYFSLKGALQSILGVVLAGVLYAALPIETLFLLVGFCYVASGLSEMFIRVDHRPSGEKLTLRLALSDMGDGLRYLRGQRALLALLLSTLFINFFFAPVGSNFIPYFIRTDVAAAPVYLFSSFLAPELWSSVFGMLTGLSSLVGAAILSARPQKDRCGHDTALRLCGVSAVMVALTAGYWLLVDRGLSLNGFLLLFCLGCLLIGFLVVLINVPVNTAFMRLVDRDKLSKITSITSVLSSGLTPIASVVAGVVLQYLGSAFLLLVCTLGFTATALFLLFNKQAKEI